MKGKKIVSKFFIIEIVTVMFVLAFDLFLKAYSELYLQGENVPFIKGIINLTYVENRGAAFGILQGRQVFFKILTVIALGVFMFFLYKNRGGNIVIRLSLALIIGGTAGNFIDRVNLNYVRDMIEFDFVNFAVFNIADCALTVGVTLFAIYYLFIYKEPDKKQKSLETQNKGTESNADLNENNIND